MPVSVEYITAKYAFFKQVYKDNSGPAFAIFKSIQSGAAFAAFLYAPDATLYIQLPILFGFGLIGTVLFAKVDMAAKKRDSRLAAVMDTSPKGGPKPGITVEEFEMK
jgi:hypothetical protein